MFFDKMQDGQLLRHKYGGFYRTVNVIYTEPLFGFGPSATGIVLKHIWPFEQKNQTRQIIELEKFDLVDEADLIFAMNEYVQEEYQAYVADMKAASKKEVKSCNCGL